jgi:antagonist of KipI
MTIRVLEPGLYTLLVDFGRPGYRSLGVPVGGAADRSALTLGNSLVGNPPDAAALEVSLAGPVLQTDCELACVLYGAPFQFWSDRRRLMVGKTFTLQPGEELHIGGTAAGMRAYFCVRGGLGDKLVLGSRSALEPLRAGAELPCQPGVMGARYIHSPLTWNQEPKTLRVLEGPQAAWFDAEEFYPRAFTVTPASNRMGLRLQGDPLTLPARELVSEPVCPGAVQVTRDGQGIILGVDGQTIGGYPKIAQVISADLDKLGQLRPGDAITFLRVSLEEAERLYRRKQEELKEWVMRLRIALGEDSRS